MVAWSRDKFKARRLEIASLTEKLRDLQMDWETNMEQIKDTSAHIDGLEVRGVAAGLTTNDNNTSDLNSTHIVLIPKTPHPDLVNQFCPISLCNYSYKVISKILANMLKQILPTIISPS